MASFRFLHAADLHLDSPFRGMAQVPESYRERLRESTFTAFSNLIDLAIREHVDFIVLSGDIYDASDRSLRAQLRLQRGLSRLAGHHIPVYIIHGNHDPEDGVQAQLDWPANVHFFGSKEVTAKTVFRGGRSQVDTDAAAEGSVEPLAVVCGISYASMALNDNVAKSYQRLPHSELYHIGLLHGNVDGDPNHDNYAPCAKRELIESGIDYWALGHIHMREILHEQEPWIVYPGNIQGRSVKEHGAKGCYIVDVAADKQAELTFCPLDDVRWHVVNLSIEGVNTEQELKNRLDLAMERLRETSEDRMKIVRFMMTGRGPLHRKLEQPGFVQELLQALREEEEHRAEASESYLIWVESLQVQTGLALDMETLKEQDSFLGELFRLSIQAEQDVDLFTELMNESLISVQGTARLRQLTEDMVNSEGQTWLERARELAAVLLEDASEGQAGGDAS
ncbi:hypothetical protein BVG16_02150 [Paenibacillus selenitireducens]|uniref:Calcineurin-like phosphoesterase domain-containing protein n=1 Tax=Paenibacillus selenitireducens TaxID=1324314 RepID=A0A1T2XMV8_9BACL|nr:DNA repair exonuclease [Paenibacillus selenitireducens]OPA81158.1 hypothetical protein BVG16_02150 [Paenibacillus selenitireducens]